MMRFKSDQWWKMNYMVRNNNISGTFSIDWMLLLLNVGNFEIELKAVKIMAILSTYS